MSKFSQTDNCGKILRSSGTNPTPNREILYAGKFVISVPSNTIFPEEAGVRPIIDRIVVVFPTPFLPINEITWPGSTDKLIPNNT